MRYIARFLFLFLTVCCCSSNSLADGRFYNTERIPANIPYQRAFLIFYQDSETLILQSKYEMLQTSSTKSLGWVVPVPSVPEMTSLEPDKANTFFNFTAMMTQPKITRIHEYFFIVFLFASVIFSAIYFLFLAVLLIGYPTLKILSQPTQKWKSLMKFCLNLLPLFFIAILYLFFALPCLNRATNIADVDIIKSEQVGIYDVNVIKSNDENAIIAWLNENGFKYSDNDIDVFKNYTEKQWCFVVARIQPNAEGEIIGSRGIVAPLILKFKTSKAIYPLALTSLVDKETEVLIYTLSENKQTCNNLMTLKRSLIAETENMVQNLSYKSETDFKAIFKGLPAKMNLCKFKEKLTPEQMKSDIVFEDAADNEPYQETKIIW